MSPFANASHGTRVVARAGVALVSLLVLVASGAAWATFKNFQAAVPHGASVPKDLRDPDGSAQNILLVGNDTRAGATKAELRALHAGHDQTTANADTMMLLHLPAGGGRPTIVSFPRDSWVTVPGYGVGKLNSAYPLAYSAAKNAHESERAAQSAGLIETIRTIHALTGLHVDHYMQVSLLGFYRISEAIGGVTVCLNAAQNKTTEVGDGGHGDSGIDLPKGVSVIAGTQALAFVRQRHGLPHGDLDRIRRQQYFLKSAFQKITSAGTLLNPFKMRDLLHAVGASLLTDPSLDLVDLARQFQSLTSGRIDFATIPNNGPKLIYPDGVATAIVQVNRQAIPAFVDQLQGKGDSAFHQAKTAPRGTVTLDVLNGTAVPRLASRNAVQLQRLGFHTNVIDSTDPTARTTVEYPAGREAAAKAVLKVVPHARPLFAPNVAHVTLVLGNDARVVTGVTPPVIATGAAAGSAAGTGAAGGSAAGTASATAAPSGAASGKAPASDPRDGLGCID